jgi:beta-lactamase regulating signal transducer with metallopeptidase domain
MTLEIVANAAIRMMLLAAAAWLLLRAFRVRNAHVEALVWRSTLLAGFALPALLYWRVAPSFATSIEPLEIVAAIPGATLDAAPVATGTVTMAVASIYLAVASLLLARLLVALAVMWRICRAARPMQTPDDVRVSERVRSPATFGAVILLPPDAREWPAEKLDAVLAHERAHVRTGDGYWSWLARLHAALFWFSPFAWWIQRRLETLAETTSDDAVLMARHDPADYAALLLEFARRPNRGSVAMSVAESNVPQRIERLLARIPPTAALPRVTRWAALVLMIPVDDARRDGRGVCHHGIRAGRGVNTGRGAPGAASRPGQILSRGRQGAAHLGVRDRPSRRGSTGTARRRAARESRASGPAVRIRRRGAAGRA